MTDRSSSGRIFFSTGANARARRSLKAREELQADALKPTSLRYSDPKPPNIPTVGVFFAIPFCKSSRPEDQLLF
jgi:hypothetical protein